MARGRLALRSHNGSALLQGVAALALTVLIAASIVHTATTSMRIQQTAKVSGEIEDTFKQLEFYLGHNTTCLTALGSGTQSVSSMNLRIYDPIASGQIMLASGKRFPGWKVDRLGLSIPQGSAIYINELKETRAQGVLQVEVTKSAGSVFGSTAVARQFPMVLSLKNGVIVGCSSLSTAPSSIGLPTKEGWAKYDPAKADAYGCQDLLFEGVCAAGQRALTCLGCDGVGCKPNITLLDSASTPEAGVGKGAWPTWDARWRVRFSMAMLPSQPGGALNKCVLTLTYCYNSPAKPLETYKEHASNRYYHRVAPLCVED